MSNSVSLPTTAGTQKSESIFTDKALSENSLFGTLHSPVVEVLPKANKEDVQKYAIAYTNSGTGMQFNRSLWAYVNSFNYIEEEDYLANKQHFDTFNTELKMLVAMSNNGLTYGDYSKMLAKLLASVKLSQFCKLVDNPLFDSAQPESDDNSKKIAELPKTLKLISLTPMFNNDLGDEPLSTDIARYKNKAYKATFFKDSKIVQPLTLATATEDAIFEDGAQVFSLAIKVARSNKNYEVINTIYNQLKLSGNSTPEELTNTILYNGGFFMVERFS